MSMLIHARDVLRNVARGRRRCPETLRRALHGAYISPRREEPLEWTWDESHAHEDAHEYGETTPSAARSRDQCSPGGLRADNGRRDCRCRCARTGEAHARSPRRYAADRSG